MKKLIRCIKNYFFCKKYPFWKITDNWYNYNTSTSDKRKGSKNFFVVYNYTWYDDIPTGWQKAFGKQLCRDIKKAGELTRKRLHKHAKWEDMIEFQQIKEKWGELCLYASASDEIQNVLEKYELLSSCYCINCGKPARYRTHGWIEFYCEDCFVSHEALYLNQDQVQEELKTCRLTEEDIPVLTVYDGEEREVDLKKEFNIDFKKMWDL